MFHHQQQYGLRGICVIIVVVVVVVDCCVHFFKLQVSPKNQTTGGKPLNASTNIRIWTLPETCTFYTPKRQNMFFANFPFLAPFFYMRVVQNLLICRFLTLSTVPKHIPNMVLIIFCFEFFLLVCPGVEWRILHSSRNYKHTSQKTQTYNQNTRQCFSFCFFFIIISIFIIIAYF